MARAAGSAFVSGGDSVKVCYEGSVARIDGTVGSSVAVEIEARTEKQVRGAILDLICHPYEKKLLVLLDANMNLETATRSSRGILGRFLDPTNFQVVPISGSGSSGPTDDQVKAVRDALRFLGFDPPGDEPSPTAPEDGR